MLRDRLGPEVLCLPRAGGDARLREPVSAVVAGGGIAGMAAATVLAERGARVTLFERGAFLGGRAGSWGEELPGGGTFQMERGFHGFFRQYYNLRALLRRIDPALSFLRPLDDYPILGPGGLAQSFRALPPAPPASIVAVARRTPHLRARDLPGLNLRAAAQLVAFDPACTYRRWDRATAAAYLDSLRLPARARQMLFSVFAHSFFQSEERMSAAELLMMFHFYFAGNPEGLVFDVARAPLSTALWRPLARYLERLGVAIELERPVRSVARARSGAWRVEHDRGASEAQLLVLALPVPALRRLFAASPGLRGPDLADLAERVERLEVAEPFAVWRLWLDRPLRAGRAPFAGTTGVGELDNISLFHLFEDESAAFARRAGGAVVELHAYAAPPAMDERALKRDLLAGLHHFYPETRAARAVHDRFLLRRDCPAFPPGSHDRRPGVAAADRLALAGDFVRLPLPTALMERAATSGILAANELLAPLGIAPEPVRSVPRRGLLRWRRRG